MTWWRVSGQRYGDVAHWDGFTTWFKSEAEAETCAELRRSEGWAVEVEYEGPTPSNPHRGSIIYVQDGRTRVRRPDGSDSPWPIPVEPTNSGDGKEQGRGE